MFDCHLHSAYSPDSTILPAQACVSALRKGLPGIAFTDHLDYDYPGKSGPDINFSKYSSHIDRLKVDYNPRLKVLKGLEVGLQPHVLVETFQAINSCDFDFVIASIHIIAGQDPCRSDYFLNKDKQTAFSRYLEEIEAGIDHFTDFDVLGHLGYIGRYCPYQDKSMAYADYSDLLDSILKKTIALGKGIEVNTSGYRQGFGAPLPGRDILARYRELGGEIITVGSDAHRPEHVGHAFAEARELLLDVGFRYCVHFEGRRPIFDPLAPIQSIDHRHSKS